ncbi:hypothetical protein CSKR_100951 [Clonorchis sinensis]|uniref:Uncharacterized protein n=1 Tax=Clonorchis sinensis TaxID=79923 RepID=A0A3R7FZD0_CLOSI|nr:hypothetical protein CSKR_100951 [Clonorchis sinensis]
MAEIDSLSKKEFSRETQLNVINERFSCVSSEKRIDFQLSVFVQICPIGVQFSRETQLNVINERFSCVSSEKRIDFQLSVFVQICPIGVQVQHDVDDNSGTSPT